MHYYTNSKWILWLMLIAIFPPWLSGAEVAKNEPMKLFLLIGQSNMAGRGKVGEVDKVPHPRIFMLNKDMVWVPAIDPIHFDKPKVDGVGLGSSFARAVAYLDPNVRIGLIPAAVGGTSLDQWKPGGKLYSNAVIRTKKSMETGVLAGILWHQGESDRAKEKADTYIARFSAMITQMRNDLGAPSVPVVVGELGRFREENGYINRILAEIPKHVPICAFVSSENLSHIGDRTHFDTPSLGVCGRRYAAAWQSLAAQSETLESGNSEK